MHTGSKGDQLVTVTVHTPQKLPMRSKELLIEFAKSMGEEIPEEKDLLDRITDKVKDMFD